MRRVLEWLPGGRQGVGAGCGRLQPPQQPRAAAASQAEPPPHCGHVRRLHTGGCRQAQPRARLQGVAAVYAATSAFQRCTRNGGCGADQCVKCDHGEARGCWRDACVVWSLRSCARPAFDVLHLAPTCASVVCCSGGGCVRGRPPAAGGVDGARVLQQGHPQRRHPARLAAVRCEGAAGTHGGRAGCPYCYTCEGRIRAVNMQRNS